MGVVLPLSKGQLRHGLGGPCPDQAPSSCAAETAGKGKEGGGSWVHLVDVGIWRNISTLGADLGAAVSCSD